MPDTDFERVNREKLVRSFSAHSSTAGFISFFKIYGISSARGATVVSKFILRCRESS